MGLQFFWGAWDDSCDLAIFSYDEQRRIAVHFEKFAELAFFVFYPFRRREVVDELGRQLRADIDESVGARGQLGSDVVEDRQLLLRIEAAWRDEIDDDACVLGGIGTGEDAAAAGLGAESRKGIARVQGGGRKVVFGLKAIGHEGEVEAAEKCDSAYRCKHSQAQPFSNCRRRRCLASRNSHPDRPDCDMAGVDE